MKNNLLKLGARVKVVAGALALGRFTVAQLVEYTGLKPETVRTELDRLSGCLHRIERQSTGRRGGQILLFELTASARRELEAELKMELRPFEGIVRADSEAASPIDASEAGAALEDVEVAIDAARDTLERRCKVARSDHERRDLCEEARQQLRNANTRLTGLHAMNRGGEIIDAARLAKLTSAYLAQSGALAQAEIAAGQPPRRMSPDVVKTWQHLLKKTGHWLTPAAPELPAVLFIDTTPGFAHVSGQELRSIVSEQDLPAAAYVSLHEQDDDGLRRVERELAALAQQQDFAPFVIALMDSQDAHSRRLMSVWLAPFGQSPEKTYWDSLNVIDRHMSKDAYGATFGRYSVNYFANSDFKHPEVNQIVLSKAQQAVNLALLIAAQKTIL